ncbi:hypothetical protein CK203_019302 [Vitis vinifera]|uniref:Uncharacterized protein n=1 Tax=Vitis vinifera TaxID=29760 RepID=A0A438J7W9_VITVI|nr:hypothetical protein CK203_019302 [Vitis vinifera]
MTGPTVRVRVESIFPTQTPPASTRPMPSLQSPPSNPNSNLPTHRPLLSLTFSLEWTPMSPGRGGQGGGGFMSNSLSTTKIEDYDDRHMSDGGGGGGDFSKPIVVLDVIMEPGVCLRVDGGAALPRSGEAVEAVEGFGFLGMLCSAFCMWVCVFSVPKEERQ